MRDCVCADDLRCFRFDDPVYAEYPTLAWLVQRAEDKGLTGHTEHDTVVARRGT